MSGDDAARSRAAQVYKGVRGGVQDVAVKMLHYGDSEDGLKQFVDECCILKSLNYDRNVVQFYGACLLSGRTPMLVCAVLRSSSGERGTTHCSAPLDSCLTSPLCRSMSTLCGMLPAGTAACTFVRAAGCLLPRAADAN